MMEGGWVRYFKNEFMHEGDRNTFAYYFYQLSIIMTMINCCWHHLKAEFWHLWILEVECDEVGWGLMNGLYPALLEKIYLIRNRIRV